MFTVLFEVQPRGPQWNAYFGYAKMLRPDLEAIDGFIDNIRYRSLTRPGWVLSLSSWANEKSLVRWRTRARHHDVQVKGRDTVLADYRLRVGQLTGDTDVPHGQELKEQRLDVTDTGDGKAVTLINPKVAIKQGSFDEAEATSLATQLGLRTDARGLLEWDIFDSVLEPGNPILLQAWADPQNAASTATGGQEELRHREIRVIRDYGMFDRRENPQYYPDVARPTPAE
jgi:heme-degrading monooxygenase HmoA